MKWLLWFPAWFLFMACLFTGTAWGQVSYRGHVVDGAGQAVAYATVVLLAGERQVSGTITDEAGDFVLESFTGQYQLVIQSLGYDIFRKELLFPVSRPDTLVVSSSSYALDEVVVRARGIERKADRFVMTVSPTAGQDGAELLSRSPGVWLSEGDISINGTRGARLFVDEREIRLEGEVLMAYLRSLRSEDIQRIEVIPLAGAAYDASARGGVIRIQTRRQSDNGVRGYLSLGGSLSSSLRRYAPQASVDARVGRWSLGGSLSGILTPVNRSEMNSWREYGEMGKDFESRSNRDTESNYGTGRFRAIFEPDTLSRFGAEVSYSAQTSEGDSWSRTSLTSGSVPMESLGDYCQVEDYKTYSATVNYSRDLVGRAASLKAIVDYVGKRSNGDNDYRIRQEQEDGSRDTLYRSHASADYDLAMADLSFHKNIGKRWSYQFGAKYTYTSMDDYSIYEGLSKEGFWLPNDDYGCLLRYHEHIAGAYASFSAELGSWNLSAGVRTEYAATVNRDDALERDYLDLFPNVGVTYAFDPLKRWLLTGQYARNIERPPFYALNPNRRQSSDYSYQIGNPYLRPTYMERFSLTLVYDYRYSLTFGGNLHRDLIREFCERDPVDPEVSYITYENHDRENHWFIALNLPFQPFYWCDLTANLVGVKQDIRMRRSDNYVAHYLGFANVVATFSLPADLTLEARYAGTSRLYSGNSEVAPFHTLDLKARKGFMDDKLSLVFAVENLFGQASSYASRLDRYHAFSRFEGGSFGRLFKLSLTWNFNSGKRFKKSGMEIGNNSERSRLDEK